MKNALRLLGWILIILFTACSPVVVEEVAEENKVAPPLAPKPNPNTPCMTLDQLPGYKNEEIKTAFVLYRDQVKLGNLMAAYPLWRKAFNGAPGGNGKIKYHFNDGIDIFKHLYEQEQDSTKKAVYIDSIDMVYDKRIECFGEENYIAGRRAFDYYYTFNKYVDEDKIFGLFKQNLENKGAKADYFIINPFTKMLFDRVVQEKITHEEGRALARKVMKAIEYGQANCKGNLCDAWEIISEYAPVRLEALEGIEGFYDCTYYDEKYYPLFVKNRNSCDTVEFVYRRLLRGHCAENNPHLLEVKTVKETDCYTPPPPPGPLKQAFNAYNEGDYENAVKLFQNYVDLADDPEKKYKYLMLTAKIYYRDIKNYPASRQYALKAAKLMPNSGEPFMLIGKLYASSGPLCGPGRGWDSQIVTWPAIDKFDYARKIDPGVSSEASKLIRQYRQFMPSKEDVFQRTLQAGQSFRVGCWIQETTTIRTAD